MREHDRALLRERRSAAQRHDESDLGPRALRARGAKADDADPRHVLDDDRRLLVLAHQEHVSGLGLRVAGAHDHVHVRRPSPRQPAGRDLELAVAEGDHGVMALVADLLPPGLADELDRLAGRRLGALAVGGEQQRRLDRRRVRVGVADQARMVRVLGVRGQLELGEGEEAVAAAELGQRRCRCRNPGRARARPGVPCPARCGSGSSRPAPACSRSSRRRSRDCGPPAPLSSSVRSSRRLYPEVAEGSSPQGGVRVFHGCDRCLCADGIVLAHQ